MTQPAPLLTSRLQLVPLADPHLPELQGLCSPSLAPPHAEPATLQQLQQHVAHARDHWATWGIGSVAMLHGGKAIGMITLLINPLHEWQMGWAVLPGYQGRGFAREAAAALMRHAGRHAALWPLTAYVLRANLRSTRLAQSLGFRAVAQRVIDGELSIRYVCEVMNSP
ncbi:Protein N-acetyltransferase, RimJ/RimL family [Andreprevotia lacus DSM 23236]|jgi:RimJ/RimL family protein N-acetyltransferase|uniref:Protein N-acetyltransferase, RimJ/RimL family n=1 Tax=Andreprevotia lacus DSM 23236 TaxID=1121001 RepID=A0A1W1Y187_9NEIS|nr:GNAT family N-acetyltransferase [Andreprevotia lacus]SMC29923.1 Protein N-acetyltransferase, RimJ/RimL family [Andreprevotia lacus DSM 23236]